MTVCTRLQNGVRIISHALPGRRSAALGLWVRGGVRGEGPRQNGYAHLLEHLLFRRHRARYAALGGEINACTGREWTAFHGTVPAGDAAELAGLFADALARPCLDAEALEGERRAVLSEMAELDGDSWTSATDRVLARVWDGHAMARPILGDPGLIRRVSAAEIEAYARRRLDGGAVLVTAAGAIDHRALIEACRPLGELPAPWPRTPAAGPRFAPCEHRELLSMQRSYLLWVLPLPPAAGPAFALAERIAAGGVYGLLQRTLRDRLGLVYGIHSELERHSDGGLWWLRLDCAAGDEQACRDAVEGCFDTMCGPGLGGEDFERGRDGLRAQWTIEDDDPAVVMQRIALEYWTAGGQGSLDERRARLDALSAAEVRAVLGRAWAQRALFGWGPFPQRRWAG